MMEEQELIDNGYKRVKDFVPTLSDDDVELIECMINGYQSQDLDMVPWFNDIEHFNQIMEESGAIMFLK